MGLRQRLIEIIKLDKTIEERRLQLSELRKELLEQLLSPNVDLSDVKGFVTVMNRKSKLVDPRIEELKQQIKAEQDRLYAENTSEIYEAQVELQQAEEKLAQLLTSDKIEELQKQLALLEDELSDTQPQNTKSLVIRKTAATLLDQ